MFPPPVKLFVVVDEESMWYTEPKSLFAAALAFLTGEMTNSLHFVAVLAPTCSGSSSQFPTLVNSLRNIDS